MNTGKKLEQKFQSWISEIQCYSYKPTDFGSLMYLISNFPQIKDRIPQVPCDRIVIYKGRSYFFELKHTQGKSLSISNIKNHQISALLNHVDKGQGKSFIVISMNKMGVFSVDIKTIALFLTNNQRKSIPYIYINSHGKKLGNSRDLLSLLDDNTF